MTDTVALNLSELNLGDIKTEVDAGVGALVSALTAAQKFSFLLPASLQNELTAALTVLGGVKNLLDKV